MDNSKMGKLLGQTAIYGVSSIIGRFLNYLLVPLYTYCMAAESGGYGIVTNVYAHTGLLLVLLTFGMETTFFRFATKEGADPDKAFSTAGLSVGSVALLFLVLVMAFLKPIANSALFNYPDHPEFIAMMATVVALDAFQAILFARLRYEEKPLKFAILKLSFIVMNVALNLLAFLAAPRLVEAFPNAMSWYKPEDQVLYIFVINLICTSLVTLGFIPEIKKLRHGIDFALLKSMLNYTWPLLLLGLAGILNQVADKILYRYLVPGQEGEVQLGIYGSCVKVAMIMALITQAFRYAYEPFVFSDGRDPKNREMQADVMKYFIIFTLFAFVAVMAFLPILRYLIASDYHEGLKVIPIVMMAEIFMGVYFNLSFWYKLIDQTWWGAIFSGIGCLVLLAINFIFVPRIGYMACAWGGFAGYGVCMILSYIVGQKKSPTPYDIKSALAYFALAIALVAIIQVMNDKVIVLENTVADTVAGLVFNTLMTIAYLAIVAIKEKELTKSIVALVNKKILKRK